MGPALPQSSSDLEFVLSHSIYFVKANQRSLKFTKTVGVCFCQEDAFHVKDIVSGTRNIKDGKSDWRGLCGSIGFRWPLDTKQRARNSAILPDLTVAVRKRASLAQEDWRFRTVLHTLCLTAGWLSQANFRIEAVITKWNIKREIGQRLFKVVFK